MLHSQIKTLFTSLTLAIILCGCATTTSSIQNSQTSSIKRHFVDGSYGQVHTRTAGDDSKHPPLVLLHPTPYSSQFYIPFIEEMHTDRMVIAMDTPGYGDSDRPDEPPQMKDYAQNALTVLDKLGVTEPVDVLGYHTGTLIAVEMALTNPKRVNKTILAGIPAYAPERLPDLYAKYAKPDVLEKDGSHLTSKWKFATQTLDAGLSLEGAQSHFSDYMQSMPSSTQAYYSVFSYPGYDRLPQMTRPSLFVAINGSLKQETIDAQKLTPNSDIVYLDTITTGLFDVASAQMAQITREYLNKDK